MARSAPPVFQTPASLPDLEPVTPLSVFAAGRKSFQAMVRARVPKREALAMIFAALPMAENGWIMDETEIDRVDDHMRRGFPVFKVWRT